LVGGDLRFPSITSRRAVKWRMLMSPVQKRSVRVHGGVKLHYGFHLVRLFILVICLVCLTLLGGTTKTANSPDRKQDTKAQRPAKENDDRSSKFDGIENGRIEIHPLDQVFSDAAREFRVPVEILKAVGYEASRWNQIDADPEKNETIGVMGLKA